MYTLLGATAGTAVLGFLAGLFSFKVKTKWCPDCGHRLQCVDCLHRAGAVAPHAADR
ncbi:hypothetical protein GCM10009835_38500 [Planosporangium flavigriseum]|uniref:Uncharacterized protein n=2 Tax=Planosporangium flavigriseum TaxID=373681 RepID=A0A8J3PNL8_9ACTN|nr:hypothetical protein Pfl04_24850 [Planosporangium flavigriseum]